MNVVLVVFILDPYLDFYFLRIVIKLILELCEAHGTKTFLECIFMKVLAPMNQKMCNP